MFGSRLWSRRDWPSDRCDAALSAFAGRFQRGPVSGAIGTPNGGSAKIALLRQGAVALLFFVTGYVGMRMAVDHSFVTPIWPPSGIALVAVLAFGYRMAFGIAVGSFLLNLTVGLSPGVALAIAVCDNLEYLGSAFLLRRLAGFHLSLDRRQDVVALVVIAATLATTFSAIPGLAVLVTAGAVSVHHIAWSFLKWWMAGMIGVLLVAPPLLVWLTHPRPRISLKHAVEGGALLALLITVVYVIFYMSTPGARGYYPAALAVFPFVIWGAVRFGLWGVTTLNLLIAIVAIWGTRHGIGPFATGSPIDSLIRWCVFTNVMAMTDLLLAAMASEQRWVRHELKKSHAQLERRVQERTAELARINEGLKQEMAERRRLEGELLQAEEQQQRAFGMELHDGLGQQLTSIAFLGASLRQRLEEQAHPQAEAAKRVVDLVNQASEMTRALARGLYPGSLESHGLPAALQQLAESNRMANGISCYVHAAPLADPIDPLLAINLYRSAQEAVSNAIRHGKAKHVRIELVLVDGHYRLTVNDDGRGFPAVQETGSEERNRSFGMGLRNLRYRSNLIGGSIRVDSQPEGGTTVTVIYPKHR